MGAAKQKLKSKRGASIILALMFFLICAVVGGIVLVSAASNAGRLSHMREEQQAYLTVSSAVKLLRGELDGQSCTFVETSVDEGAPSLGFTPSTGALSDLLNAWTMYTYGGGSFPPDNGITIESELGNVTAKFYMDSDYNLALMFSLEGSEQYQMTLKLFADVSSSTTRVTEDVFDESGDVVGEKTTATTITTIIWDSPAIAKGGGL